MDKNTAKILETCTRSKKIIKKYNDFIDSLPPKDAIDWCEFCELTHNEIIKKYNFWVIIKNKFPYDKIAKNHHVIVLKRHIENDFFENLKLKEIEELALIRTEYADYSFLHNGVQNQSMQHFHCHLFKFKS